jgi:hypothetical protein
MTDHEFNYKITRAIIIGLCVFTFIMSVSSMIKRDAYINGGYEQVSLIGQSDAYWQKVKEKL